MTEIMDQITGSPCYLCGDPIVNGWHLQEITQDQWEVVCVPCELVTGMDEGK